MTQPYPFTHTADTKHAKASAATRLRSSPLLTLSPLLNAFRGEDTGNGRLESTSVYYVQARARHFRIGAHSRITQTIALTAAAAPLNAQNHVSGLVAPLVAENVLVQELVAELPARVVLPAKPKKLRHPLVSILQCRRRYGRQLSPMRPGMKRGKFFLNYR